MFAFDNDFDMNTLVYFPPYLPQDNFMSLRPFLLDGHLLA